MAANSSICIGLFYVLCCVCLYMSCFYVNWSRPFFVELVEIYFERSTYYVSLQCRLTKMYMFPFLSGLYVIIRICPYLNG